MKKIRFYSYPVNCGDGSASVRLFRTRKAAELLQKEEAENGWAEDCVGEHIIKIYEDGSWKLVR